MYFSANLFNLLLTRILCTSLGFICASGYSLPHSQKMPLKAAMPPRPPLAERMSMYREVTKRIPCTTIDTNPGNTFSRNGVTDTRMRWERFYGFADNSFNKAERAKITEAMWKLREIIPCVDFGMFPPNTVPSKIAGDFIQFVKGRDRKNGCNSFVGRLGIGAQVINLSPSCMGVDSILHEMLHALGFEHEHNRHDRDDHVTILLENANDTFHYAFEKLMYGTSYNIPYNPNSIMHYTSFDFSKNGKPVILAKNGTTIRGGLFGLQQSDIAKLKAMYNCSSKVAQSRNQITYEHEIDQEDAGELTLPGYNEDQLRNEHGDRTENGLDDYYDPNAEDKLSEMPFDIHRNSFYRRSYNESVDQSNYSRNSEYFNKQFDPDLQPDDWVRERGLYDFSNGQNENEEMTYYDDDNSNRELLNRQHFPEDTDEEQQQPTIPSTHDIYGDVLYSRGNYEFVTPSENDMGEHSQQIPEDNNAEDYARGNILNSDYPMNTDDYLSNAEGYFRDNMDGSAVFTEDGVVGVEENFGDDRSNTGTFDYFQENDNNEYNV